MNKLIKYLQYNNKESPVFVPNEIFKDLQKHIKSKHIPFTYAYYYLTMWLYRYVKHSAIGIDNKKIKEVLGYSPTYTAIDYIIKKNGLLDTIGYTLTEKDYPIAWTLEDERLEFEMLSDMDEITQMETKKRRSRKYTVKFPVKAFYRYEENMLDGTFYDISNTHEVPFEVFLFCMSKKEIGCTGFYLWSYLKMMNQLFGGGYDIGLSDLSGEVGIEKRTLTKYLGLLRSYKMVNCYHNQDFFCVAMKDEEKKANTYITNEYDVFTDEPIEYEKIRVIKKEDYLKMREKIDENEVEK